MNGYPYSYGDIKTDGITADELRKTSIKASLAVIALSLRSAPAFAQELTDCPAYNPEDLEKIAKVTFAMSCATAGWACKSAVAPVIKNSPAGATVIACVAFASWCAAKASPL